MSVVLRDLDARQALLPLAAAVAVSEACETLAPVACRIKWPNDVWVDGRKLAGVLIEGRPQEGWSVLGIGVNVTTELSGFPADIRDTATSLRAAGAASVTVEGTLAAVLGALQGRLTQPAAQTLASWRERDALMGYEVRWQDGNGTVAGIDDSGALLVDAAEGRVSLDAGEVHLLR